jgi:uncharacterized membrane protein YwaF
MFFEKQSLSPLILYSVVLFGILSSVVIFFTAPNIFELTASEGIVLAVWAIFIASILGFIFSLRLDTEVSDGNLSIKFWPISRLSIPISDITRAEIMKYKPTAFFGWVIRPGLDGTIYSMRGQSTVRIVRHGGSVIYVRTEKPEELLQSIRK